MKEGRKGGREGRREGGKESDPILECLKSFLPNQPVCPLCPAPHGHTPGTQRFCSQRGVALHILPDKPHGRGYTDVRWC